MIDQLLQRRWLLFALLAVVVVAADQASKLWIDTNFATASTHPLPGAAQPTDVIDGLVRIAKAYNSGGIFGLFGGSAAVLAISSTVVIAGIVLYEAREGVRGPWLVTIALGLLLGGAIGNFIDRVRLGAVIDFVDMGIGNWRFYTFNVADAAISTSLFLLILFALFGEHLTRRLEAHAG